MRFKCWWNFQFCYIYCMQIWSQLGSKTSLDMFVSSSKGWKSHATNLEKVGRYKFVFPLRTSCFSLGNCSFIYLRIVYSFIYMHLFEYLKAKILKSTVYHHMMWNEGKKTAQATVKRSNMAASSCLPTSQSRIILISQNRGW